MTAPRDPDRLIRAFLAEGQTELPDRTYDAVRDHIDRIRQGSVVGRSKAPRMNGIARLAIAAAAVVVVAVLGISLVPSFGIVGGPPASRLPSPSTSPSLSQAATSSPKLFPLSGEIDPGRYYLPWPPGSGHVVDPSITVEPGIYLAMPAGWFVAAAGTDSAPFAGKTVTRHPLYLPSPTLTLTLAHDVTQVVADVCVDGFQVDYVEVGPTVEDLTAALANQVGIERSGPTNVTLGGYPAKRFVLTLPSSEGPYCPGPEGKQIWADATTMDGLWILQDGTATIYVVDVNGDRLVITSLDRGSPADDLAQLEAIVGSIHVEP